MSASLDSRRPVTLVTKALLLEWANAEFPAYYRMISTRRARDEDFKSDCVALRYMTVSRRVALPRLDWFPAVRRLDLLSFRRHECFFDARFDIHFDDGNGTLVSYRGRSSTGPESSRCLFHADDPSIRAFCEHFVFYLVFNVLYEEEISLEEWPDLPD